MTDTPKDQMAAALDPKAWRPEEFAVCIGMDALRLCLGQKPRNFTAAEVTRWIKRMGAAS